MLRRAGGGSAAMDEQAGPGVFFSNSNNNNALLLPPPPGPGSGLEPGEAAAAAGAGTGAAPAAAAAARAQYSVPGILHFLQHEWGRFEAERAEWEAERAELQVLARARARAAGPRHGTARHSPGLPSSRPAGCARPRPARPGPAKGPRSCLALRGRCQHQVRP